MPARLLRLLMVLVFGVTGVAAVGAATPAAAAGTASISGTITAGGAEPLVSPLVTVRQYLPDDDIWVSAGSTFLADGMSADYAFTDLEAGTYRVEFYDYDSYAAEYWDGHYHVDEADLIDLADGQALADVDATLEHNASISGRITDANGDPVPDFVGVRAWVQSPVTDEWTVALDSATLGGDGEYEINQLQPGTYKLEFHSGFGFPELAPEYWNDKSTFETADVFTLVPGQAMTADAQLAAPPPPVGISGTVTEDGGGPLSNVCVTAHEFDGVDYQYADSVCTDAAGDYAFDLEPGTYKVEFYDGSQAHAPEWYDDEPTKADATPITVTSAGVTGIDAGLEVAATISGTVTDEVTGDPIEDAFVYAYHEETASDTSAWASTTATDASGDYTLTGLGSGSYVLAFGSYTGGYLGEYYDDVRPVEAATPVAVTTGGAVADIDAELGTGGTVAGTVTSGGDPVESVSAILYEFYDGDWHEYNSSWTDPDGYYSISDVQPGTYRLKLDGEWAGYVTEWWDDSPDLAGADDIVVTTGATTTADAEVVEEGTPVGGGSISGTVTSSAAGTPALEDVCVRAWYYDEEEDWWDWMQSDCTDAAGAYTISGLAANTYHLEFSDTSGDFITEFWDDQPTVEEGDDVVVATDQAVTGKNAQLTAGGHIAGTVTNGTSGIDGVWVTAYALSSGDWDSVESTFTDADGDYDIGGLAAGTYRIGFEGTGSYVGEFYDDADTVETGTDVPVTAGATTGGRDAVLSTGATITGALTGPGGTPVSGGVYLYKLVNGDYENVDFAVAGAGGTYSLQGVATGTYKLRFASSPLTTEWWNNAPNEATATPISVTAGQSYVFDAQLAAGATIAGTVTGAGGAPVSGATVTAYEQIGNSWSYVDSGTTNGSGGYQLTGLPAGTYTLSFAATGYIREYWDDKPELEDADPFTVAASATVTGKNAQLAVGGHITGTVTAAAGGANLAGVDVDAYRLVAGDWVWGGYAETAANGTYDVAGLPAGTYRVRFGGPAAYLDEWWNDKPTLQLADDVTVAAAGTAANVNAALSTAGQITGSVTAPGGAPLEDAYVEAYLLDGGEYDYFADGFTNASGAYTIGSLPSGTYKVLFYGEGAYANEWWNDKPSLATADAITVTAGATQSGISAELATGASIQGTVTATGGAPLADISVYAYRVDGSDLESVGYDETAANGTYDVGGLPAGDYKLEFVDEKLGNAYAAEWWNDALTPGTATAFTVAAASTVSGKNAVLIPGGHITGTVTGPTGSALAGVDVTAYRLVDGDYQQQNYASTNGSGAYDLNGLPQGTYKVEFDDGPGGQPTEYWNDAATFGAATTIAVAASATVPNISAQLGTPVTPTVTPGTPTISGTPQVGSMLTANPGTWNPVDVTLAYQWLANDVPIGGANGTTFTPTAGQLNATIKVTVTGTKLGWTQASNTSAGVGPVTGPAGPTAVANTGLPTVSGVAKVGATLTASGGSWNPSGVTLAYQWLANGAPIAGATGTSYSVPAGDVGKQLSVRVTGSMSGFTPASATSPATGAVAPGTIVATKKPKLTGKAKVSKTLGLDVGKYVPAGAKVKIAWFLNGKKISGQKKNSLAIKAAYLGKTITAEVTVTAAGYSKLVLETKGKKVT